MAEHRNRRRDDAVRDENAVYGRNAVLELLNSEREIDKIAVKKGEREGSITTIVAIALKRGIPVVEVEKGKLDAMCGTDAHQGVCATASAVNYVGLDDILEAARQKGEDPFIAVLDGVDSPHNVGAILRVCDCAGVHGVIIPKRRAAQINAAAVKASAGAANHVLACRVSNIASTIDLLKKKGLWIFASEAGGDDYRSADFSGPVAVVFGSEGEGISRLVHEKCDKTVSIPMFGKVNSLNVSCASAVILTHAAMQKIKEVK